MPIIKLFFLNILLLTSPFAFSTEIVDSKNILKYISGWQQRADFKDAFQCDKTHSYFFSPQQCPLSCDYYGCEIKCKGESILEAVFYVEGCGSGDLINLYSDRGHTFEITAQTYNSNSRTMILDAIQFIPTFLDPIVKIEVESIFPIQAKIIEDGRMKTLKAIQVALKVYPNLVINQSTSVYVTIDSEKSGLNQILCISDEMKCNFYFFKRKGYIYGR